MGKTAAILKLAPTPIPPSTNTAQFTVKEYNQMIKVGNLSEEKAAPPPERLFS